MSRVIAYQLVIADEESIEEDVKSMIILGWSPIGSITIHTDKDGTFFYQPVVKYESEPL